MHLRGFLCAAAAAIGALSSAPALAQSYPSQTIRIIVGISPEGTLRLVSERLQAAIGQTVVVEPRPGASGEIALKAVATAPADGYTMMYASSNTTLAKAMKTATVDIIDEFEPVALLGQSAFTMMISNEVPAKTVPEFVAYAKANPGKLNCGSTGVGTPGHLGCEMLNKLAGVNIVHVPYKSVFATTNGLVSNQVQVSFLVSSAARPLAEGNQAKALAVAVEEPTPLIPGVQPMHTFGYPGFIIKGWGAFVMPKGTPKAAIDKVNAEVVKILSDPEVRARILSFGLAPASAMSADEVGAFMRSEVDRWNRTIDLTGVPRGRPQ